MMKIKEPLKTLPKCFGDPESECVNKCALEPSCANDWLFAHKKINEKIEYSEYSELWAGIVFYYPPWSLDAEEYVTTGKVHVKRDGNKVEIRAEAIRKKDREKEEIKHESIAHSSRN